MKGGEVMNYQSARDVLLQTMTISAAEYYYHSLGVAVITSAGRVIALEKEEQPVYGLRQAADHSQSSERVVQ